MYVHRAKDRRPVALGKTDAFDAFVADLDPSYRVAHPSHVNRIICGCEISHLGEDEGEVGETARGAGSAVLVLDARPVVDCEGARFIRLHLRKLY